MSVRALTACRDIPWYPKSKKRYVSIIVHLCSLQKACSSLHPSFLPPLQMHAQKSEPAQNPRQVKIDFVRFAYYNIRYTFIRICWMKKLRLAYDLERTESSQAYLPQSDGLVHERRDRTVYPGKLRACKVPG